MADVRPEFGARRKAGATVAHALSHQAGVPAIREPLTNEGPLGLGPHDRRAAATEAWYEPGAG